MRTYNHSTTLTSFQDDCSNKNIKADFDISNFIDMTEESSLSRDNKNFIYNKAIHRLQREIKR